MMKLLQILLMAVLQILPMAVLQILPLAVLEPLAGDAALGADAVSWPVIAVHHPDGSLGAFGVHHPDGRHRCGEDAILEPMEVLRILPDDEIIGADAVLNLAAFIILMEVLRILPDNEIMGSDGSLGAVGHGEPSCRSNRWPVMQLLERMPS